MEKVRFENRLDFLYFNVMHNGFTKVNGKYETCICTFYEPKQYPAILIYEIQESGYTYPFKYFINGEYVYKNDFAKI